MQASTKSIRGISEAVEASTESIQRISRAVDEATDAIQRNREAVEQSTEAIVRNRQVTERITSLMGRFTPGHHSFWALLVLLGIVGAVLVAFFVLVITLLRIRRSIRRLERQVYRIGRARP